MTAFHSLKPYVIVIKARTPIGINVGIGTYEPVQFDGLHIGRANQNQKSLPAIVLRAKDRALRFLEVAD